MNKPTYLILGAAVSLAASSHSADLFWDPDGNSISDGGAGLWSTGGTQWYDSTGMAAANWASGDNATFGKSGATYQVDVDGAGVTVGDLTLESPTGTGKVSFVAQTDGAGITVASGGAVWDLGGRELELVNNANANDTTLSMSSGDTLTLTDSSASGVSTFDSGEKPNNIPNWAVDGAFLVVQDPMIVRGQRASIGAFSKVTLAGGSTLIHERNNDPDGTFTNEFEFDGGQVKIGTRYNRRVTFNGGISGTGGMIIDPGNGNFESVRLGAANTFTGDITVVSGDDSNETRGNVGIRLLGLGTLGDGTNLIELQNGKRIQFNKTEEYTHSGGITGLGGLDIVSNVVTLSGVNDYEGETFIQGASLVLDSVDALSPDTNITLNGNNAFVVLGDDFDPGPSDFAPFLGSSAGEIQWTSGGGFGAINGDRSVSIDGGGPLTFGDPFFIPNADNLGIQAGSLESTHTLTVLNSIVLPTSGSDYNFRSENGLASIDGVFAGAISGDGGVDVFGGGVLKFGNASNSYLGNTNVLEGTLLADPLTAVPNLSSVTVSPNAAFGGSTSSLSNADFDNILATATFEAGSALAFDTSGGNYTYSSNLTGSVGVAKIGPNDLTLDGTVSYTGATIIYQGNINFPGGSLPTGSTLTLNNNQIDLAGNTLNTGGLASFTDQASIINTGANADLTFDVAEGLTRTFTGTLGEMGGSSNDFNILKRGLGNQFIADINYYTGTTMIEAGRMDAPQPETLGLDPALTDLNRLTVTGGELRIDVFGDNLWTDFTGVSARMSGGRETMLGLNLDLSTQPTAGTWNPSALTGNHGYRINAAASGNIIIFDETNSYTGDTVLVTGTINVLVDNAFGSGGAVEIVNNGTQGIIDLNGTNQTIGGLYDTGGGGGFTKSLDNSSGSSLVTINVPSGEYYQYSRNIRENTGLINFVKNGEGEQVIQRNGTNGGIVDAAGSDITVNAGTFGLNQAYEGKSGKVTVNGGLFELEGSLGFEVEIVTGGAFGPGINGDDDNDGISDEVDEDTTTESTIGTGTVTNLVSFGDASTFEFEIGDWNGADDLGGIAGTDSDLLIADDFDFAGSLEIVIGAPQTDFTETPRTIVIMQATATLNGFNASSVTIDDSAFAGTGSWAAAQNGLNIELTYTPGGGDAYDTWASTNITSGPTGFDEDANGDGLANGLNFVLGGNPNNVDFSILPSGSQSAGDFSFDFKRSDDSEGITTQTFQWSTNLSNWNDVAIGAASSGPDADGVTVTVAENTNNPDDVTIFVPGTNAPDGKVFGRFIATRP